MAVFVLQDPLFRVKRTKTAFHVLLIFSLFPDIDLCDFSVD